MTTIHHDHPVTRETFSEYRGRPLVVRLTPRTLEIREKGRRDVLAIDYGVIYEFALKLRWRRLESEKREAKLQRKRR
jgi:hypothetical protein